MNLTSCGYQIRINSCLIKVFYLMFVKFSPQQYTFDKNDNQKWQPFLQQHGFAVLSNVLNAEEVSHTHSLFWQWLEALGSDIKRDNIDSWDEQAWPGCRNIGFFVSYGGCHTKASWYIRTHPQVRKAFSRIWETEDLITSFDTFICWRPWWTRANQNIWYPFVENVHVDQNPHFKKGFHCVQGMVVLVDVVEEGVGGLQVVPNTNNDKTQEELVSRYEGTTFSKSDWLELSHDDPFVFSGQLVLCKAGSLILFDSRTVHGGKINKPTQQYKAEFKDKLVRLAMTVTMVPRQFAKPSLKDRRLQAFQKKIGLTHWPQQYNTSSFGAYAPKIDFQKMVYDWPQLTPQIDALI